MDGGCACGKVGYAIKGEPMFRAFCHCLTCQQYNQADHADVIVMRAKDVAVTGADHIAFKSYQNPPIVKRGKCSACDGVAVETVRLPLIGDLTILPAQTLHSAERMPKPAFHMFYNRRIKDIADDLPKHAGYLASQWAFSKAFLKALMRKKNSTELRS